MALNLARTDRGASLRDRGVRALSPGRGARGGGRGPCTPSTRLSSMSLVADGPLIQVCGRRGSSRATASGTSATTWSLADDADVPVGQEGERPAALAGAVVEHDRAGLGDADGAPVTTASIAVEVGGGAGRRRRRAPGTSSAEAGRDHDARARRGAPRWSPEVCGGAPGHLGPVVGHPLGEQVEHRRRAAAGAEPTGVDTGTARPSSRAGRAAAQRRTHGGEASSRALMAHSSVAAMRRHQARNDSRGGTGQVAGLGPPRPGPRQPGDDADRLAPARGRARPATPATRSPRPSRRGDPQCPGGGLHRQRLGLGHAAASVGVDDLRAQVRPGCRGCRWRPGRPRRRRRTAWTRRAASPSAGRGRPLSSG